jgi:PAS domain S-box-containing protein
MTMNKEPLLPPLPPLQTSEQTSEDAPSLTLEKVFDAIEDGICVQSLDGRIAFANSAFAAIVGAPLNQIVGRACAEVFGCANEIGVLPQFCPRVVCGETGQATYKEINGKQPGQRLRARASPARDESGEIVAYVMVARDITETVASERESNRRRQTARFGEMAASLAHEIKNPLAGIQGVVDILIQRRNPNDPERALLEGVRGEVKRIDAIVQSLLDRAQPIAFNFQLASVNAAVHRAVTLANHHAKIASTRERRIQVELIVDPTPITMRIDAAQIEDAVYGLLTNAIEAIDGDGIVTVRLSECGGEDGTGGEVIIEVEDNGRGIREEDLPRIFSPFFSATPNGAGLGLPAIKRAVHGHGGRIEVASTPGQGSTFTIRLPRSDQNLQIRSK